MVMKNDQQHYGVRLNTSAWQTLSRGLGQICWVSLSYVQKLVYNTTAPPMAFYPNLGFAVLPDRVDHRITGFGEFGTGHHSFSIKHLIGKSL